MLKPPCATVRRSRGREPENHREPGPGTRAQAPRSSVDRTRRDRNDWLHRSSYTPPELDKPRTYSQFPYRRPRTNRTATHRPPDWRLLRAGCARVLRAGCARGARGRRNNYENRNRTVADRSRQRVTRSKTRLRNRRWEHTCHDGGFVKRTYRPNGDWFTGCLPACCRSALQDFRNGTRGTPSNRHFTQAVKHRHFTSTAIETHMPCAAPGHTPRRARGRTRVCRCPA